MFDGIDNNFLLRASALVVTTYLDCEACSASFASCMLWRYFSAASAEYCARNDPCKGRHRRVFATVVPTNRPCHHGSTCSFNTQRAPDPCSPLDAWEQPALCPSDRKTALEMRALDPVDEADFGLLSEGMLTM